MMSWVPALPSGPGQQEPPVWREGSFPHMEMLVTELLTALCPWGWLHL